MAFEAAIGFGGKLEYYTGATWADVGRVVDIRLNVDVAEADASHQQGPQQYNAGPPVVPRVPFMEAIPGKASCEVTFNCIFDPGAAQHQATILDFLGQEKTWRYTFPDDKGTGNSEWTFGGFYRTPNISIPNEDKRSADVTIRVTGAPTFAGTAAT